MTSNTFEDTPHAPVSPIRGLGLLDRLLPLWIVIAMAVGVAVGKAEPGLKTDLERLRLADVSLPVGIGLIWMMYPILAKVRYGSMGGFAARPKLLGTSLVLNWVVGPVLMFVLAWTLLPDHPEYRNGLILVGLARCIAMVLVWNMLAHGSEDLAALLVALNSIFQIFFYSVLGYMFLTVVPGWLGAEETAVDISMWLIARNVLLFLGLPLLAGALTRYFLVRRRGAVWYDGTLAPRLGPIALVGLLYTIVVMFINQGDRIVDSPVDVGRIAVPLAAYFALMFSVAFIVTRRLGFSYEDTTAVSFTAAGNNFELAIAVAIGVFGVSSGEAFATVVGPLIEVPVLVGLVYLSLWLGKNLFLRTGAVLES
ncbi:MAG: ACR3 family arsenite efflux transporter [Dehalococcoidia bacterium]|nr:ACR3 family arsenite efflux transporter [Dehalococcoidia bacterium]